MPFRFALRTRERSDLGTDSMNVMNARVTHAQSVFSHGHTARRFLLAMLPYRRFRGIVRE